MRLATCLPLAILAAAILAAPAAADPGEIVLTNGDVLRGDVTWTPGGAVIEHESLGRLVVPRDRVSEFRAAPPATEGAALSGVAEQRALATLCGGADPCAERCWKLKGAVAASLTEGNSDTIAIAAGVEGEVVRGRWTWKAGVGFVYNESEGDTTAERWHVQARGEYAINWRSYVFGQVAYDADRPAGLDYRWNAVGGYGHVFFRNDRQEFKGEIGAGAVLEQWDTTDETTSPSAYAALRYEYKWADKKRFKADLEVYPNLDDSDLTFARLVLGYEMPLCDYLSLLLGARFDYVVSPPDDKESLDTLLTLGLTFGI